MALLTPRDAIHIDDLDRYDEYMKTVAGNNILNMYQENQVIKVDIHEYPNDNIVRSAEFKPSPQADAYFKQDAEMAKEFLAQHESFGDGSHESRAECHGLPPDMEDARSRCFQFCGYVTH
ncbi:hypothetical protein FGADI_13515, partial [Fusarium gaditjirri]